MMKHLRWLCIAGFALFTVVGNGSLAAAEDDVTLETVVDPGPNVPDEPQATAYSLDRAVHFLDSAALSWQKQRKCFTCHTNYAYLYARPLHSPDGPALQSVRDFARE
ncbi:MAG: squalene--hopene cyclase, partial [Planctomycetaceae bacterium]|nr:squalene--hopene cyclase [Planctomycetaceae bacterium]